MSGSGPRPIPALAPLGWLYAAATALRNAAYDRGVARAHRAGCPVVSIGNLTAGGTGKTPAVAWLAQALAARGRRVAIVSRGHGGRREGDPLLVARDGALLAEAAAAGDEPVELARAGCAPLVAVGIDRVAAAALACGEGAEVIVLDDGFQHRRLARDLDVVLVDHDDPFGGGRLLPAGLLRESPAGLARAGLVLVTRAPARLLVPRALAAAELPAALAAVLARLPAPPPVLAAAHRADHLVAPDGTRLAPEALAGRRVAALSGIARPEAFHGLLETLGARVVDRAAFPDHHPFTMTDLDGVARRAAAAGAEWVVTTAKDAVRLPPGGLPVTVLTVRFDLPASAVALDLVDARLAAREAR